MRRPVIAVALLLVFSAPTNPALGQVLPPPVMSRAKNATVFVKAGSRRGSGFIFRRSGSAGLVLTCEHVVSTKDPVEIVLWSGTKDEKTLPARRVAADPSADLACLAFTLAANLPDPLDLATKTEIKETETVYAAGFPFGEMLATSNRSPDISLTKATVSSIRRNAKGNVAVVQVSGDINPGHSGGPILTSNGRVIGVIQSKVTLSQTAFATPPEAIQDFFIVRPLGLQVTTLTASQIQARVEVSVAFIDPLCTVKAVGIAYMRDDIHKDLAPNVPGQPAKKAHPTMKDVPLRYDADTATASGILEVNRATDDMQPFDICYQIFYTVSGEQAPQWTPPQRRLIEFSASKKPQPTDLASLEKPAVPPAPPRPDVQPVPSIQEVGPGARGTMPVSATLPLRSVISRLLMNRLGTTLYALDLSECTIYRIEAATLKIQGRIDVAPNAIDMSLSPKEETLYVVGWGPGMDVRNYNPYNPAPSPNAGFIQAFSTNTAKTAASFAIDHIPTGVEALGPNRVAVTTREMSNNLLIFDITRRKELDAPPPQGWGKVQLHPDENRLYATDSRSGIRCLPLKQKDPKTGKLVVHYGKLPGNEETGTTFTIFPDGDYLVLHSGLILSLSPTPDKDMQIEGKIDPFVAVAPAPRHKIFYTSTAEGFIKEYAVNRFELTKSYHAGRVCSQLLLDPVRKVLHAVALYPPPPATSLNRFEKLTSPIGDIVTYSLDTANR